MNNNEGTIPQQIARLEGIASTMREALKEARVGLVAQPVIAAQAMTLAAEEQAALASPAS